MTQTPSTFAFGGGLDTNSAALAVAPGAVMASMNYEPLAEGYGRMQGYERYDGRPAPSQAQFWTLQFTVGTVAFALGDTVTGATSGATAIVIALPDDLTGTFGAGNAAGTLIVTNQSGGFVIGESLRVGGVPHATCTGPAGLSHGATNDIIRARKLLAQAYRRGLIQKVPGSGAVRGVAVHAGNVYAWRDNAGATACVGWKATAAGWTALPVLRRMFFTAGTGEIFEGDTITGGSSGATALVRRVVVLTGAWGSSNAAGYLDLSGVTGAFTAAEAIKVGGVNKATGGTTAEIALPPGGRYRTISHNFYGNAQRYRMYGTNGVGPAFEMLEDGAIGTIPTGMTTDTPNRIFELSNHLGLIFPGGSVQFSGTGEPRQWQVILGAGEIGLGTEVTDVIQANETAVALFGETKIAVLQGHDASDFALDTLTEEAGAFPDTAQRIAKTVYIDRRGLRSLDATQAFGNFKTGTLSGRFERYFRSRADAGRTAIGSFVCKTKSHYRLMWDDGTGLAIYMGGKVPEALVFNYGDLRPSCFGTGELADSEGIFVGGEDGYVYRLDSGNSHDGVFMESYLMTPFNHFGAPVQEDRFHKVVLELDAPPQCNIGIIAQFDYGDGEKPESKADVPTVYGGGGIWSVANYDEFYWSAPVEGRAEAPIDGIGRNASFIIISTAHPTESPHVLQAYIVYRSPRKFRR